jgi:hypothetical protein
MTLVEKLLAGVMAALVFICMASAVAYRNYTPSQEEVSQHLEEEGLP